MEELKEQIEDLKEYREKLGKLTEEEKKKRDLYLKGLADGTIQGPPTGYSEIDKPWLQYYEQNNIINANIPDESAYTYLLKCNENKKDNIALNFMGLKFNFSKFEKMINDVAYSLKKQGVKKDDVIVINSVTLPQSVLLFYAANKIGAVVNTVDLRSDSKTVRRFLEEGKSTFYVTLDQVYEVNKSVVEELGIEKTLVLSPYDLVPGLARFVSKIQSSKDERKLQKKIEDSISIDPKAITWKDFYQKTNKNVETVEYEKNKVAAIVHTSGSTGFPKSIALTNENFNAMVVQYRESDFKYNDGDSLLNIIPMFTAYGLVNALHMPLCLGITDIVYPKVVEDDFPDIIKKFRPNHVIAIPMHWEYLLKASSDPKLDLSFIKTPASGGDKMDVNLEKKLNDMLKEHGTDAKIVKGYGMTEVAACAVTNSNNTNEIGNVGIPFVKNSIKIVDPETGKPLKTGETGEILISSPSSMKEYINNTEETKKTIIYGVEGEKWIKSGDLGHVEPDGKVEIDGRLKRMIIRKGFKISATAIEESINSLDCIEKCVVVKQKNNIEGEVPFAFIVLKEEFKDIDNLGTLLEKKCRDTLPEFYNISDFKIVSSIPYTKNAKVDLLKLEEVADYLADEEEKSKIKG